MKLNPSRREALRIFGATAGSLAVTGCVSEGSENGADSGEPSENQGETNNDQPTGGQQHESAYDHPELSEPLGGDAPVYQYWEEEDREILGVPEDFVAYETGEPGDERGTINIEANEDRFELKMLEGFKLDQKGEISDYIGEQKNIEGNETVEGYFDRNLYRLSLDDRGNTIVVEMDTDKLPREEDL